MSSYSLYGMPPVASTSGQTDLYGSYYTICKSNGNIISRAAYHGTNAILSTLFSLNLCSKTSNEIAIGPTEESADFLGPTTRVYSHEIYQFRGIALSRFQLTRTIDDPILESGKQVSIPFAEDERNNGSIFRTIAWYTGLCSFDHLFQNGNNETEIDPDRVDGEVHADGRSVLEVTPAELTSLTITVYTPPPLD